MRWLQQENRRQDFSAAIGVGRDRWPPSAKKSRGQSDPCNDRLVTGARTLPCRRAVSHTDSAQYVQHLGWPFGRVDAARVTPAATCEVRPRASRDACAFQRRPHRPERDPSCTRPTAHSSRNGPLSRTQKTSPEQRLLGSCGFPRSSCSDPVTCGASVRTRPRITPIHD